MSKLLFIIAPQNFRDEEYFEPKEILENAGHTIVTASSVVGVLNGSQGGSAQAAISLADVHQNNYDAVLFVGGQGSYQYDLDVQAHRIAQDFYAHGKLTTAICHAPIILAQAGVLYGKNATVHSSDVEELKSLGVKYSPQSVAVDGTIITADGPSSATVFGKTIASHLL